MSFRRFTALLVLALLLGTGLCAAAPGAGRTAAPPAPTQWVTDSVGFLSPGVREALNQRLASFEKLSGVQLIVWIGDTIGNQNLEVWAADTFSAWGIGQKGKDNGLVLFILTKDRKIRIEVGYGLEGRVTDLLSFRVIQDVLKPGLAAGKQDQAVTKAADILMTAIDAQAAQKVGTAPVSTVPTRQKTRRLSLGTIIIGIILAIGFLFLFITNPALAMYLLFTLMSGGGGGGGLGGGGFSGGGGRSGGGGASGGW